MYLANLELSYFRSYETLQVAFCPNLNCFFGANGQGKTNILEAIHFLALTKGFHVEKDVMNHHSSFFLVKGTFVLPNETFLVSCGYQFGKGKKFQINGVSLPKLSEHIGHIPLVSILPEDIELISEGGAERRKWIDSLLCQFDIVYLHELIAYEKVLQQRNAILSQASEGAFLDLDLLHILNEQMVRCCLHIAEKRQTFIIEYCPIFQKYYAKIVSEYETATLNYQTTVFPNSFQGLLNMLQATQKKDIILGRSTIGIHKDECNFFVNEKPVKQFGSQGQKKSFLVALKLAQYEFLAYKTNKPPLILLDDIFDKLDADRVKSIAYILLEQIKGQAFITDTSYKRLVDALPLDKLHNTFFFEVQNSLVTKK